MVTKLPIDDWREIMLELIETRGWKLLVEEWTEVVQELNQVKEIGDSNQLFFVKGQLQEINSMLDLPNAVKKKVESK